MNLYTKGGKPLQVYGEVVYSRSGTPVGRISGNKVTGTDGRYVGTIEGDRLVYRSIDSAVVGGSFSTDRLAGSAAASAVASAVMGDEPDIPN